MSKIRSSILYSLASSNVITAMQFAGTLIIARLLRPEEIGLYSVASVVVALSQIVRDLGASGYIVQVKELTPAVLRGAFGLMLLSAGFIGGGIWFASPAIATFYGEPAMQDIMRVLALNFALTPVGSVTLAVVRREMRFRAVAIVNLASTAVSLISSIVLAQLGYGAMSLAWGAIAGTLATFIGSLILRPATMPWAPSLYGIRPILTFGSLTTGSSILSHLNMSASDLVLGKFGDMGAVAYFNRAASLNRFFGTMLMTGLQPVLLPALSQIRRDGSDMKASILKATSMVTGITWPVYAVIAVLAEPLILVMFGDQWVSSIPLVPYIALTALLSSTYTLCGASYTARGKPSLNLLAEGINLPIKVALIVMAAPLGVLAVARVWPLAAVAGAVVHQILLYKTFGISPLDLFRPLWRSLAVTLVAVLVSIAISQTFSTTFNDVRDRDLTILLTTCIGSGLAWFAGILLFKHPLATELRQLRRALFRLRS